MTLLALLLALAAAPAPAMPHGFVELDRVDPTILQDMRYFTRHNFMGRRVDGYRGPTCILQRRAARALARAQDALRPKGLSLKVYDCYRPQRAVDQFVRWAANPADDKMKREFYPHVDKSRLFDDGYIATRSGHSRGSTVDLTLVRLPAADQPRWTRKRFGLVRCYAPRRNRYPDNSIGMGTAYDCFDARAHTLDPRITGRPRRHRLLLKRTMEAAGFEDYANEWWHFTLGGERYPNRYFDFPVERRG
ncbi:MAG TPA: M15 family metallopeptidase [Solirubrobacteraceae bacterium]|jgi:zinc D-Ala-D-Ala dipeptidase|nr:M15 family metallopeptidase [Solirubrobacteraceae bacterium]